MTRLYTYIFVQSTLKLFRHSHGFFFTVARDPDFRLMKLNRRILNRDWGFVSVPKMLRWSAWWVFSTLNYLMGGKLMVKKHNLHKCTCPFFLFWPFLIRSSLAECQLNNQLLGLGSIVQNMVILVVKVQVGVWNILAKFCLNVNIANYMVTGFEKLGSRSHEYILKSLHIMYLIFWNQIQVSSFYTKTPFLFYWLFLK